MLKSLYEELGKAPRRREARRSAGRAGADARRIGRPIARQSGDRRHSSSRTRLNRAGSEKVTWHIEIDLAGSGLDYTVGDSFGIFPTNDPALVDAVIKALDAPADFPIGGRTLREVLTDGVSLAPAPDMLFQLYLVSHRRRAAAEGEGAGGRRRSGRRCRDARRARRDREIPRHPPRPGSLHRGARSAAAAALLDLVLAEDQSRPRVAHRRHGALRDRQARRASASPRPSSASASSRTRR